MPGVPYKFESIGAVQSEKIPELMDAMKECTQILGKVGLGQEFKISIDNAEVAPKAVSSHTD